MKRTILLVDDTDVVRDSMTRLLKSADFEVLTANDGIHALEVLQDHAAKIDAIISDVSMPRMGGVELLRSVRRDYPKVPVIVSSSYCEDQVFAEGMMEEGAAGYLTKPAEYDDILNTLQNVLDS